MTSAQTPLGKPPRASSLSSEDLALILEALKAYQHHSAFNAVYQKVARLSTGHESPLVIIVRHSSL